MVCRDFRLTSLHGAIEGKTQENNVKHYNLDVIISVGYRVKSLQGTQFRIWATQRLRFMKNIFSHFFLLKSEQTRFTKLKLEKHICA